MSHYTTMSLEAIKLLCSVINKTVDLPTSVISDTSIATNTTHSSYKLKLDMDNLETELRLYVDSAIAGLNKLTKEIINDKSLVVKDNVLYLYKADTDPSNDYMQMMLINGVAIELGSTQVDLSSYYDKTEIDNKFAAKLDLDTLTASFNDLKDLIGSETLTTTSQTVTGAINELAGKSQIVTLTKAEYDGLAIKDPETYYVISDDEDGVVISNTINSASTNNEIPTNKAVYDALLGKIDKTVVLTTADELNSFDRDFQPFLVPQDVSDEVGFPVSPKSAWLGIHLSHAVGFKYPSQIAFEYAGAKRIIYRISAVGVWGDWMNICATSVTDYSGTATITNGATGTVTYKVKNGVCYVSVSALANGLTGSTVCEITGIPKTSAYICIPLISGGTTVGSVWGNESSSTIKCDKSTTTAGYASFSYPVAE